MTASEYQLYGELVFLSVSAYTLNWFFFYRFRIGFLVHENCVSSRVELYWMTVVAVLFLKKHSGQI